MINEPTIAAPFAAHYFFALLLAACIAAHAGCNLVLTLVNALCRAMESSAAAIAGQAPTKTSSALRAPSPQSWRRDNLCRRFPSPPFVEKVPEGRMRFFRANALLIGKTVMAMMMLPRYRNQTVADLQHLVLEPMIRDRIAMAYPGGEGENAAPKAEASANVAGFAIWASVSEEVDKRIREQIKTGTFPLRLKPEDWTSGDINWLLDVIAPSAKLTSSVLANFGKVVKGGNLRLHPLIARLVDEDTLKKLGAEKMGAEKAGDHQ
jgi:cytolysin-activating lysine-acyltransferase